MRIRRGCMATGVGIKRSRIHFAPLRQVSPKPFDISPLSRMPTDQDLQTQSDVGTSAFPLYRPGTEDRHTQSYCSPLLFDSGHGAPTNDATNRAMKLPSPSNFTFHPSQESNPADFSPEPWAAETSNSVLSADDYG